MSDSQPQDEINIGKLLNDYSEAFDKLCRERHEAGAKEYGAFTFLGNDVVRMLAEELADTSNYCRMQFVKIMMLNEFVQGKFAELADDDDNITIGIQAFKGAGEVGWN